MKRSVQWGFWTAVLLALLAAVAAVIFLRGAAVVPVPPPDATALPVVGEPVPAAQVDPARSEPRAASAVAVLEEKWGIEAVALRLSAGGRVLDFRYKVLHPEKASGMAYQEDVSYLVDEATGKRFDVLKTPKLGSLRESAQNPAADRTYSILIPNPQSRFKTGSQVTLVIGEFRATNLVVQ